MNSSNNKARDRAASQGEVMIKSASRSLRIFIFAWIMYGSIFIFIDFDFDIGYHIVLLVGFSIMTLLIIEFWIAHVKTIKLYKDFRKNNFN